MKIESASSALANIQRYLVSDVATPFIVVVDDITEYTDILNSLVTLGQMRVSDYCTENDAFPDIDALFDKLTTILENTLLLGLGESISLGGNKSFVGKLKDLTLSAKVVVLCRGIRAIMKDLCANDKKFDSRKVCFLKPGALYEIIKFPISLSVSGIDGFKTLLSHLENGANETLFVKTSRHFIT